MTYLRRAAAIFLVYDITNTSSFDEIKDHWVEEVKRFFTPGTVIAVVGNKTDLESERVVSRDVAENYAKELSGVFFTDVVFRECSAITGEGVQELFEEVCRMILKQSPVKNDNDKD